MLGHYPHASETLFKWRCAGGPIMSRLKWYLDPTSPHQLKQQQKKNVVKVGPSLTKLSGSRMALMSLIDPSIQAVSLKNEVNLQMKTLVQH